MTVATQTNRLAALLRAPQGRPAIVVNGSGATITVELDDELFVRPDRGYGDYVARRATREFHADLLHAEAIARQSVHGSVRKIMSSSLTQQAERCDERELVIDGQQVMQAWEHPYMAKLAQITAAAHGDVLEVGFGMGISASAIQDIGVRSHTIIECHPDVQQRFKAWRAGYPDNDIRLAPGRWEEQLDNLGQFDAILFDAYPLDEREWTDHYVNDVTYARHFFEAAADHLRSDGVFTYYSNEVDSMSRSHQRALFEYFEEITTSVIHGLEPPEDCHYWQTGSFVVISARGSRRSRPA
jgi:guanidinoacetate N-methyltransferase